MLDVSLKLKKSLAFRLSLHLIVELETWKIQALFSVCDSGARSSWLAIKASTSAVITMSSKTKLNWSVHRIRYTLQCFPNLFWFVAPLLSYVDNWWRVPLMARAPRWSNRYKDQGFVLIGGTPGTSSRRLSVPQQHPLEITALECHQMSHRGWPQCNF